MTQINELRKLSVIKLVEEHKKHCNNPDCCIVLALVRQVLDMAGLELTDKEKGIFI